MRACDIDGKKQKHGQGDDHEYSRNSVLIWVYTWLHMISGTVAQVLSLPPHSKKVIGAIAAWGAVGSGGQVLPRPSVLRWAISRAFLCGVCMSPPVFTR